MLSSEYITLLERNKLQFSHTCTPRYIQSQRHIDKTYKIGAESKISNIAQLMLSAVYLLQDHLLVQKGNLQAIKFKCSKCTLQL